MIYLEKILLSATVYKINKRTKRQERSLLVTTKGIYNISRQNPLTSLMSKLVPSLSLKRRIDITKVSGITLSDLSSEFVIHINDEYDYRYVSTDRRDEIIMMITRSYYLNLEKPMGFYFKVESICIQENMLM